MDIAPQTRSLVERGPVSESGTLQRPALWERGLACCSRLIGLTVVIMQAHLLGVQAFGIYLFVQWLALLSEPALRTQISTLASRRIADLQSREAPRLVAGIFYFLWYHQHRQIARYCVGYFVLAALLAVFVRPCSAEVLLLAGLGTLPLQLSNVVGTTLRSLRRTDLLALLDLFGGLLTLLLTTIIFQIQDASLSMILLIGALASTITLILSIISLMRVLPLDQARRPGIFLRERLLDCFKQPWLFFLFDAVIWQNAEMLLLICWLGPELTGYYALCAFISNGILGLAPALFTNWILPGLQRYGLRLHYGGLCDGFIRSSCGVLLLAAFCNMLIIWKAPLLIEMALGRDYLTIVLPLRILLVSAMLGSAATISMTHLAQVEAQRLLLWLSGGTAVLKVVLLGPLAAHWGLMGAVLACACAQSCASLAAMVLCYLHLRASTKVSSVYS